MKKKKRKNNYRKLNKRYQGGGMYSDNTVQAAGQGARGSTANIVFDESNPAVLAAKMKHLSDAEASARQQSEGMASEIAQQVETDKARVMQAAQSSTAKMEAGADIVKKGIDKAPKWIEKLQGLRAGMAAKKATKALVAQRTAEGMKKITEGTMLSGTMPTIGGAAKPLSLLPPGTSSFSTPGITGLGQTGTGALNLGADKLGADLATKGTEFLSKNPVPKFSPTGGGSTVGQTKGGLSAALKAYKAQRAANKAIKAGTLAGQTSSAAGAGWGAMSSAAKGNVIGAAAGLVGAGLKKWGGDDDPTRINAAEWSGELLSGAGTGIGVASGLGTAAGALGIGGTAAAAGAGTAAATGLAAGAGAATGVGAGVAAGATAGSVVPVLGTAIGAVVGLGYGAWKAITARNKARRAKRKFEAERRRKIGEHNRKVTEGLTSARAGARAGELQQKTYSGYDLGRNVVAQKGGLRMGMPRYGFQQ